MGLRQGREEMIIDGSRRGVAKRRDLFNHTGGVKVGRQFEHDCFRIAGGRRGRLRHGRLQKRQGGEGSSSSSGDEKRDTRGKHLSEEAHVCSHEYTQNDVTLRRGGGGGKEGAARRGGGDAGWHRGGGGVGGRRRAHAALRVCVCGDSENLFLDFEKRSWTADRGPQLTHPRLFSGCWFFCLLWLALSCSLAL